MPVQPENQSNRDEQKHETRGGGTQYMLPVGQGDARMSIDLRSQRNLFTLTLLRRRQARHLRIPFLVFDMTRLGFELGL